MPQVAIIRGSLCDERGNVNFEQEGAYLGALDLAMAAHNNGGIVIAQVKQIAENETVKPHQVRVPGILVDYIVKAPDQWQTTQTPYDPAISGEVFKPLSSFSLMKFGTGKAIARRVARELKSGWAVSPGFGVSANVPRILIEEGLHGKAAWVIEQGAGGFVDITARARKIVYSGFYNAGARMEIVDGKLRIDKEGKVKNWSRRWSR